MTSIVYRSATAYRLAMRVLYRGQADARLRAVAERIPAQASVLDLCCGPPLLYRRHLKARGVDYLGVDINAGFIRELRAHGGKGITADVRELDPLPRADYVIMQASLYHFLPDAAGIVAKMRGSAGTAVVIAEPVRNLAQSPLPWVAAASAMLSDAGRGPCPRRFDEDSLAALMRPHADDVMHEARIAGGREKLYVVRAAR